MHLLKIQFFSFQFPIMLKIFLFAAFLACLALLVHAQDDQSGFVSIDCGTPEGSNYTDPMTGIRYVSGAGFTDSGTNNNISSSYITNDLTQQFLTVSSFPEGPRNCYTVRPPKSKFRTKYLIRARFLYGNYDGQNQVPTFDLHLGADKWTTITLDDASTPYTTEMIHVLSSDFLHVCLVNTGGGTPFISALELRLLNEDGLFAMYATLNGSLQLFGRIDIGSTTNQTIRYKDDRWDRIWRPLTFPGMRKLNNPSGKITYNGFDPMRVPEKVMKTAGEITENNNSSSPTFFWEPDSFEDEYYMFMHFAELQQLPKNQTRQFNIYLNNNLWFGNFSPKYLRPDTVFSDKPENQTSFRYNVVLNRTGNSTLPPIINAVEVYKVKYILTNQTADQDVVAIRYIKSTYGVTTRNWQGDPCNPQNYSWTGLNCSYDGGNSPRIISLNLASSGLKGEITSYISSLPMLQLLDLSDNNLSGKIPHFLSQLASLRVLNLKGNNFTGPIPPELIAKAKTGSLLFSYDQNDDKDLSVCQSGPCNNNANNSDGKEKKKHKFIVPVVASVAAFSLVLIVLISILLGIKRRGSKQKGHKKIGNNESDTSSDPAVKIELKNRQFTYSEILRMTNNFETVIGKGGFGTVYLGFTGDCRVAVKMLSPSSVQGHKEFQAEASLLMNVHHKNLTSLVGYCIEGTNLGIIYEYMANGSLDRHLSGKNPHVLIWEDRIRIASDAAEGLEYLHHGCKPPIVHRDIKTTNILLDDTFQAKLSDLGLSRVFPIEGGSHVTTIVAGTPGYLDPEYYTTNRLTEKSDVYSFGVVLLEIITGRNPLGESDNIYVVKWVASVLEDNGDIGNIVDPRLFGDFEVNSAWKVVELGMACVEHESTNRPTMASVASQLKMCLMEIRAGRGGNDDDSMPLSVETDLYPTAC